VRLKQPVRGIFIGGCIDGSPLPEDIAAHAHITRSQPAWAVGYICARSKRDLWQFLLHEIAHLAADTGHDERWRTRMRGLGARIPAAHRKRCRTIVR
jgi:hypothetical protein